MPAQCGISRGASSTNKGSDVVKVPITSSAATPSRISSRSPFPRIEATTTCFGGRSARRPSVNAMSITGTIEPRRLKMPIMNMGASGILVTVGHSTTSSTSSTERQNRSRPARKTQYCRSGSRSSTSPETAAVSVGCKGSNCWLSSAIVLCAYELHNLSQKLFRFERLYDVAVRALLLCPELVAVGALRTYKYHGYAPELGVSF